MGSAWLVSWAQGVLRWPLPLQMAAYEGEVEQVATGEVGGVTLLGGTGCGEPSVTHWSCTCGDTQGRHEASLSPVPW